MIGLLVALCLACGGVSMRYLFTDPAVVGFGFIDSPVAVVWISVCISSAVLLGSLLVVLRRNSNRHNQIVVGVTDQQGFTAAIMDTVDALVIVMDTQGRIVNFNRACERCSGYPVGEVRGRRV